MTNFYQAPGSNLQTPNLIVGRALLAIGLAFATTMALIFTLITPQFKETLDAFGTNLPWPTNVMLRYYPAVWLLDAVVVWAWLYWSKPQQRALAACLIGVIGSFLIGAIGIVALYLPIFKLGSVV